MDKQRYHSERRRIDQFINAAVIRLRAAASSQQRDNAQRAAEDLTQSVDELLDLMGGHKLLDHGDCPDCGQIVEES